MCKDLWPSFGFENDNADLPSAPPPSLERCEEMLDEMLKALERENVDVDFQFPTPPDISYSTYRVASTLPQSTYSGSMPGLTEDISTGNTEYSFISASTSNHPPHFNPAHRDIPLDFEYNNVGLKHNPVISESSMFPPFQHDHVVNAHPDDGPYRQLVGISPQCLSAVVIEKPPPAIPIDPPASTPLTSRVFTGPIRTKRTKKPKKKPAVIRCDQCGRGKYNFCVIYSRDSQCFFLDIKGKFNLKVHMKTHDPNRERPFVCPESDCGYGFTRVNDLTRHVENTNIHRIRAE